ncbi:hypothetical protein HDU67_010202 [Dinochytrium kinnereticum]|nr:hypothetical protein HDU67_010202 [Dinochytrium kinnereticum]
MRFIAAVVALAAAATQVVGQTIVEALVADPEAATLVKVASDIDGVVDLLAGVDGPVTLFAPTNAAFDKLIEAKADLSDKKAVGDILFYHVVPGTSYSPTAGSTVLSTLLKPEGLDNQPVVAAFDGKTVTIKYRLSGAKVVKSTPILKGKGVIHFIDTVLLPPQDIVTVATNGDLTSLLSTIEFAGIGATVAGLKGVTIFAPTNAAFEAIAEVTKDLSKEVITDVLTLHVVPTVVFSPAIIKAESIPAVETLLKDQTLAAAFDGKAVTVAGLGNKTPATVVLADIVFNGGVVHVIDTVLLPGAPEPPTTDVETKTETSTSTKTLVEYSSATSTVATLAATKTTYGVAKPTNLYVENSGSALVPVGAAAAAVAVAALMA